MNDVDKQIEEILNNFLCSAMPEGTWDIDIEHIRIAKSAITDLMGREIRKAVEDARSKDPLKCEQGHPVVSHNTADGWCCACEADIAFLESQLADQERSRE